MGSQMLGNSDDITVPASEFRVALQTILGFAQLLQSTGRQLTPAQAGYLDKVESAANALLAHASTGRVRGPRLLFERIVISIDDAVAGIVRELRPALDTVGVEVEAHRSGLSVLGDREQLEQMLANLLTCALRSTEPGRTVHVRAHRAGDAVQLTLSATGISVPLELTLARRLAEMMGGDVDWRHEGDGTTAVTARLPAA